MSNFAKAIKLSSSLFGRFVVKFFGVGADGEFFYFFSAAADFVHSLYPGEKERADICRVTFCREGEL